MVVPGRTAGTRAKEREVVVVAAVVVRRAGAGTQRFSFFSGEDDPEGGRGRRGVERREEPGQAAPTVASNKRPAETRWAGEASAGGAARAERGGRERRRGRRRSRHARQHASRICC